jgi:hypothetical protein
VIVSFFPYFAPTCREILTLHLRIIEPVVNHVVITESDRSQAGLPVLQNLREVLQDIGWSDHRVTVIDLKIPQDQDLEIQPIDVANCYELNSNASRNTVNLESQRARARERLQKDSLLQVLDQFPDDTVFCHSDCDEIMDPRHMPYISGMCRENPGVVIKIPLVYLQGRGDLRVYDRLSGRPALWHGGMFLAMKSHFAAATPTQIRSNNYNPWPIMYITENGKPCWDLGWHFSWMGDASLRWIKSQNFAHHADAFSWLDSPCYDSPQQCKFLQENKLAAGHTPPSGDRTQMLELYDTALLPPQICQDSELRQFFLPDS